MIAAGAGTVSRFVSENEQGQSDINVVSSTHVETVVLLSKGEVDSNMYQRPELDYLICNDPMGYADLVLNGNPGTYLKTVTEYKPLDS